MAGYHHHGVHQGCGCNQSVAQRLGSLPVQASTAARHSPIHRQDAGWRLPDLQFSLPPAVLADLRLGALIGIVHHAGARYSGIVLNAGAFTHFAWSLHDALKSVGLPVVEVHLSNPAAREPWRHESVIAPVAIGSIAGFGGESYVLGVEALVRYLESK